MIQSLDNLFHISVVHSIPKLQCNNQHQCPPFTAVVRSWLKKKTDLFWECLVALHNFILFCTFP